MKAVEIVGWNVRSLRVARGISQEALAVDSDIDVSYLSGIETGRANPSLHVIERIARALAVEFTDLAKKPGSTQKRPKPLKSGRKSRR